MELGMDLLVMEILPRVGGGKTLIRCKCVCKTFNQVISSANFIQRHLQYTSHIDSNRLLILPNKEGSEIFGYDLDGLESPVTVFPSKVDIIGSSNGLLCVRGRRGWHWLINPITQKYTIICHTYFFVSYGFGFDDIKEAYKLVAIRDRLDKSNNVRCRVVFVYSLQEKTRLFDFICPEAPVKDEEVSEGIGDGGVLINNSLIHWLFSDTSGFKRIGCFDIRIDQWVDNVHLPEYYYNSPRVIHILSIGVLEGFLCCSMRNEIECLYEVWVMEEYGVKESWSRLLSVPISDRFPGGVDVVARVGRYRVLLKQRHGCDFFWYNIKDQTFSNSAFAGVPYITPCVYKNTFVTSQGVLLPETAETIKASI